MSTLSQGAAPPRSVRVSQDLMLVGLRLSGWLATTLMATLGIATLFFLVLGGFSLEGMMLQLDNLASRFLAADAGRREQFEAIAFGCLLIGFVLIGFFRRASLFAALLIPGDDQ